MLQCDNKNARERWVREYGRQGGRGDEKRREEKRMGIVPVMRT